jgi:hypothetical protein
LTQVGVYDKILSRKRGDIMSYEADAMRALSASLRNTEGLKQAIREANDNIEVLKTLALELSKANQLKEIELGLRSKEEYSYKTRTRTR